MKAGVKEEVYKYIFWGVERAWNLSLESSKNNNFVLQVFGIQDWNGVSWTQLNSTELTELILFLKGPIDFGISVCFTDFVCLNSDKFYAEGMSGNGLQLPRMLKTNIYTER
jgi:hypothetical protein